MSKKNKNEIVVSGQKIKTTIEEIDIFKLHYWQENPRVNSIIKQKYADKKTISDEEVEKELWQRSSVKDLYKDIEKHGGLIDEIFIKDNVVLEGNSRLCAYRYLYKKAEQNNDEDGMLKWSYIRARVIPKETESEIIFSILGTWHIKGKAEWDTYEKAAYLKRMNTDYGHTIEDIANMISKTEKFVQDHIDAHDMMVKYKVYDIEKFSYFYELIKNKHIRELATKDVTIIPSSIEAIKEGRFKRAEEMRHLHKVLKDKKAKKDFLDAGGDFDDALDVTKGRHPEYEDSLFNHIKKVTKLLATCPVTRIEEIKKDGHKQYLVRQLCREVISFSKKIDTKQ